LKLWKSLAAGLIFGIGTPLFAVPVPFANDSLEAVQNYIPAWRSVQTDVCRDPETDHDRCTFSWTLQEAVSRSVIPDRVAQAFLEQLEYANPGGEYVQPTQDQLCPGQPDVAMTFYDEDTKQPVFISRMSITLPVCADALRWNHFDAQTQTTYELYRVLACGNVAIRVVPAGEMLAWDFIPESPLVRAVTAAPRQLHQPTGLVHQVSGDGGSGHPPIIDVVDHSSLIDPEAPPIIDLSPVDLAPVPLPAPILLLFAAIGSLLWFRRRT
jgi:hypothetical protein